MARRTRIFPVNDKESRDNGKSYLITEMAAEDAEWWAFQVLQALLGSDAEIDFNVPLAQMAKQGLAALGKMPPDKARPLLEQMMSCVSMKLPGTGEARPLLAGDIEEVKTRVLLRKEVLGLHVDFFTAGGA